MQTFWPKKARDKLEVRELLLDSAQRSIFSLIFFLKTSLLITISIFTLSPKQILCPSNNFGSRRQGTIGSWLSSHKLKSVTQCHSWRRQGEQLSLWMGFLTIPLTMEQQRDKSQAAANLWPVLPHAVYVWTHLCTEHASPVVSKHGEIPFSFLSLF